MVVKSTNKILSLSISVYDISQVSRNYLYPFEVYVSDEYQHDIESVFNKWYRFQVSSTIIFRVTTINSNKFHNSGWIFTVVYPYCCVNISYILEKLSRIWKNYLSISDLKIDLDETFRPVLLPENNDTDLKIMAR